MKNGKRGLVPPPLALRTHAHKPEIRGFFHHTLIDPGSSNWSRNVNRQKTKTKREGVGWGSSGRMFCKGGGGDRGVVSNIFIRDSPWVVLGPSFSFSIRSSSSHPGNSSCSWWSSLHDAPAHRTPTPRRSDAEAVRSGAHGSDTITATNQYRHDAKRWLRTRGERGEWKMQTTYDFGNSAFIYIMTALGMSNGKDESLAGEREMGDPLKSPSAPQPTFWKKKNNNMPRR